MTACFPSKEKGGEGLIDLITSVVAGEVSLLLFGRQRHPWQPPVPPARQAHRRRTSRTLMTVASTSTATAIPNPISFVTTSEVKIKAPVSRWLLR